MAPKKYPIARELIRIRGRVVFGSLVHLAANVDLSRQSLNARISRAEGSKKNHPWFEFVLSLPEGSLAGETLPENVLVRPSPSTTMYALAAQSVAWVHSSASKEDQ